MIRGGSPALGSGSSEAAAEDVPEEDAERAEDGKRAEPRPSAEIAQDDHDQRPDEHRVSQNRYELPKPAARHRDSVC